MNNAEQIADWNGDQGQRWADHQALLDRMIRPFGDAALRAAAAQPGERVLDVGSGGGVPGAILAIVRSDLEVTLSDSVAKKARALEEIVRSCGVAVRVCHAPAQTLLEEERFDTLTARAVAPISKLLTWFAPHWDNFNRLLIIKGPAWVEERAAARSAGLLRSLELRKLCSYPLPGTESESVILSIRPKDQAE